MKEMPGSPTGAAADDTRGLILLNPAGDRKVTWMRG
jgi:hypothetical protein